MGVCYTFLYVPYTFLYVPAGFAFSGWLLSTLVLDILVRGSCSRDGSQTWLLAIVPPDQLADWWASGSKALTLKLTS